MDDAAREGAINPAKVDLNVLHGAPDAPAVDVVVRAGSKIVSNLTYGQFTPYLSVDPSVYYLDVKPAGNSAIVGTFNLDSLPLTITDFPWNGGPNDVVKVCFANTSNPNVGCCRTKEFEVPDCIDQGGPM